MQRKPLSPTEARLVQDLEDVLTNARNQIPGNFSDRLKEADRMYYEKIGIPFSAQGIRDIDAKQIFEKDDEVGVTFDEIKKIVEDLENEI